MKWLLATLTASALTLYGADTPKNEPPAYDADLFKKDAQVFSFHGSFLYWRVQESALDYALKMKEPAWGPENNYAQGKFEKTTFNGDPGFRVAASFFRAPHYWEIWGVYTRLAASGHDRSSKPKASNEYLTGTWPQITEQPLSGASTHIHLNYNVADLLTDRVFLPNPHLRLRFIGGGTAAWMNQDWKINYYDSLGNVTTIRNRWKYVAGGLRIGSMVDWFFAYDIYITGSATTAIFMGSYQNRAEQTTTTSLGAGYDPSLPVRKTDYRDARPAFHVQAMVGPSWQKNYPSTRIEVFAGYELNTWFNVHEIYRSTSGAPSSAKETQINTGALALQGLTARVTVDF